MSSSGLRQLSAILRLLGNEISDSQHSRHVQRLRHVAHGDHFKKLASKIGVSVPLDCSCHQSPLSHPRLECDSPCTDTDVDLAAQSRKRQRPLDRMEARLAAQGIQATRGKFAAD